MKMWDGRFEKPMDALMEAFGNSLPFDKALADEDISGSIAWAHALKGAGVLSARELKAIVAGLERIRRQCAEGTVAFLPSDEDIHMAVERLLVAEIGAAGARLHTGRSRNDQVATDMRLFVKRRMTAIAGAIGGMQKALLKRAEAETGIIIPAYTHLQQAQPVSLAHYWLSFLFLLERDKKRCLQAAAAADCMPLGSGACAGSGFSVDREDLAQRLGFDAISDNSMDGVASRDFLLEALGALAALGISLSRYAEDLIIWSTREFRFVELDDAWSTGSSMMPQKKNPDSLELVRGKCGRFIGNYTRFAVTLKGLSMTYCKDLQEDKEPFFDSVGQMELVLPVFTAVIRTLKVDRRAIEQRLDPFLLATDLADYLARKGVAFRAAHKVVGAIVAWCQANNRPLTSLSIEELQKYDPHFGHDSPALFNWKTALAGRDITGGTGPKSVRRQIVKARGLLGAGEGGTKKRNPRKS
jgi:argininosuccinate lyase